MSLERELKLDASLGLPDLDARRELAGFPLAYRGLERQENSYYDTPALALRAAGATLRVRLRRGPNATPVLTFKDAGQEAGAVVSREEIEVAAPEAIGGAGDIPHDLVRERVLALSGGADLTLVARTRTKRRLYDLAGVGELVLDEVEVLDPDGEVVERFAEVELEAVEDAGESDLQAVRATLEVLAPLRPSLLGKYSRALAALASGPLDLTSSWRDFAARTLAAEIERLRAFAPIAAAGLDPEGVHGMRVSTRRLRSAMRLFKALLPGREDLSGELRWLGRVLGEVRDHDVLADRLPLLAEQHGVAPSDLAPLLRLLAGDRREARAGLLRALASARYRALLAGLAECVRELGAPSPGGEASIAEGAPPALEAALRSLRKHARQATRQDAHPEDVHSLRKAAKRLRYALEFVEPALPAARALAGELKDLQGTLGEVNDRASAAAVLSGLVPRLERREEAFTAGRLVGRLEAELADLRGDLAGAVDKLRLDKLRHKLSAGLDA